MHMCRERKEQLECVTVYQCVYLCVCVCVCEQEKGENKVGMCIKVSVV